MKTNSLLGTAALMSLAWLSTLNPQLSASPVGTAFTYQGKLADGGNPANGNYDLRFTLYDAAGGSAVAGPLTNSAVAVTNGSFTVTLDFGAVFDGNGRWLELGVRSNGVAADFTVLSPRQPVTPVPYALFASNAATLGGQPPAAYAPASGSSAYVARSGDTMSGPLNLPANGLVAGGNQLVLSGGNVGIGTATPVTALDVNGEVRMWSLSQPNVWGGLGINATWDGGAFTWRRLADGYASLMQQSGSEGGLNWSVSDNGSAGAPIAWRNPLQLTRGGDVVIDWVGANTNGTLNGGLRFGWSGSGEGIASQRGPGGNQYGLDLYTASQPRLSIANNGNVGVGTTNPATKLDVTGGVRAATFEGNGAGLTGISGAALADGAVTSAKLASSLSITGDFSAGSFSINGTNFFRAPGTRNTFVGSLAGNPTMGSFDNTGIGWGALNANSSGYYNTANGSAALEYNTTGNGNTAVGYAALLLNDTGSANTATGCEALRANTSGFGNTAGGTYAMHENTIGSQNTASGFRSLYWCGSGSNNTAVGYQTLHWNGFPNDNTAIGALALYSNQTGSNNTACGSGVLVSNLFGNHNTAAGYQALNANTAGNLNTANGVAALYSNTTGDSNTASGAYALYSNTTGSNNTAGGAGALYANTHGHDNAAFGINALCLNQSGYSNTAHGAYALCIDASGYNNTAVGAAALYANQGGYENTAIGVNALRLSYTSRGNTAVGCSALQTNSIGDRNTALGLRALQNLEVGTDNIAIGRDSGANLHSGDRNIYIGLTEELSTESDTIRIGNKYENQATYIKGIYGKTAWNGVAVYINSSGKLGTTTSSRRFKEAITDMGDRSVVLLSLRPVSFRYKPDIDPQGAPQFGLVAEEVEQVAPELVVHDDTGEPYTVRYEQVNAMLLNEFLKEHRKVEQLEARLENLERLVNAKNGGGQ